MDDSVIGTTRFPLSFRRTLSNSERIFIAACRVYRSHISHGSYLRSGTAVVCLNWTCISSRNKIPPGVMCCSRPCQPRHRYHTSLFEPYNYISNHYVSVSKMQLQFNVDIYNPDDRTISVQMPNWYSYNKEILIEDTLINSVTYQINITGKH